MLDDSHHGFEEFFVADRAILILVNLSHDLSPDLTVLIIRKHLATLEDSLELLNSDLAILIKVNALEQLLEVLRSECSFTLLASHDELLVRNQAVVVHIVLVERCQKVMVFQILVVLEFLHSFNELVFAKMAVS